MTPNELKDWRRQQSLSQGRLSELLGVKRNTVARWELSIHPIPKWANEALQRIGYVGQPQQREGLRARGLFYVIQLVPDLKPERVKLGWTSQLMKRLDAHKCAAPTAVVYAAWECFMTIEKPIISAVTTMPAYVKLGPESFDVPSLDLLCAEIERFITGADATLTRRPDSTRII